jgi:penicillin amidase
MEIRLLSLSRFLFRLFLGRRLPATSGALAAPGLKADAVIRRDRWGVPMIEAGSPRDAAYALGFCHGQDRGFQLEVLLRVTRGQVAEMAGAAALPVDRLSRRIGFHHSAMEQLPLVEDDVRELLDGYSDGVNAGRSIGSPSLPHEFALLGVKPTPWGPADTLAVGKLLSFTLCSNWDAELVRLKVLTEDGEEALRVLDPSYPEWHPVTAPPGASAGPALDHLAGEVRCFLEWAGPASGSNNWAISGKMTATGRPILANDPHLDARLPSPWYLASLRCPQWAVAGATIVGGPAVLAGHNGHAAWGLTAGLVDNTDLFLEEVEGSRVKQGDGWVECPVREEVIHVKGGSPVTERVVVTPRGPIVGPGLPSAPSGLSLRAAWLDPVKVRGFFGLHGVRSFAELREAFRHWPVSSQNVLYADASGVIGWQLVGDAPVRGKGHGALPGRGSDPAAGWVGKVPYEEMPHLEQPECGWLATANNRPLADGKGPFLGVDFVDGYRMTSIVRELTTPRKWDLATTMRLQTSQRVMAWEELREAVLGAEVDDLGRQGQDLLKPWDGVASEGSAAAAVYEVWLAGMIRAVARSLAPNSWEWVVGKELGPLTPYNFGCFRRTAHLVKLIRTEARWSSSIGRELGEAVRFLRGKFGPDPRWWAWGRIRPLVMHHPLSKAGGMLGGLLRRIFNLGPVPCGGDADVINQAAAMPLNPLAPTDNIASMRMVVDVGAWENSRWVLPAGQSGNPLSPHYADLLPLWQRGEGVAIAFTPADVEAASAETLRLTGATISGG